VETNPQGGDMQVFTITNNCVFPYTIADKKGENTWNIQVGEIGEGRSVSYFNNFIPLNPIYLGCNLFKVSEIIGNTFDCLVVVKCLAPFRNKGKVDGDVNVNYCPNCFKESEENLIFCKFCGKSLHRNHKKNPMSGFVSGIVANGEFGDLGYFRQFVGFLRINEILSVKTAWEKKDFVYRKYFGYSGDKLIEVFR